jgi:Protein of unknown function (DUF3352)
MNHEDDLTPGSEPDPAEAGNQSGVPDGSLPLPTPSLSAATSVARPWWSRYSAALIAGGGVAVLGAAAAAALVLAIKPSSTIDKLVPATANVYALAYVDPSTEQKLNLLRAVHRFPDTANDQKVSELLDKALKDSGLSFSADIQPWLGAQAGFALQLHAGSGDQPGILLVASRDDVKARAALLKLRSAGTTKGDSWQDKTYNGVVITVGTPTTSTGKPGAYAIVDHVAVFASSETLIQQVIDADSGRAARLVDSSQFKSTMAKLPADRLAFVYVDAHAVVGQLKTDLSRLASPSLTPFWLEGLNVKGIGDADAARGAAMVLSAKSDGVVVDAAITFDTSKLSEKTRTALLHPGKPSGVVGWIPKTADGFWAAGGFKQTIQALLDQAGSDPSLKTSTDQIGLTGANGVLNHLTGEFALEATVDGSFTPAGALLLGTGDATGMRTFFGRLVQLAAEGQTTGVTTSTTTYRGVTITSIKVPSLSAGGRFVPSYAVVDGMGILASSTAELRAIVDAHRDHSAISADATYTAAAHESLAHPSGIFYLDLDRVVKLLNNAPATLTKGLDAKSRANLAPLRALLVSSDASQDTLYERVVVLIK